MKRALLFHLVLTAYLWLIDWISLGNWNRQASELMLPALLHGHGLDAGDVGFLLFISLPAILFFAAYRRSSLWFGIAALIFDAIWMAMQIQSWWIPYFFGSHDWHVAYAKGPTTKLLPSFVNHPAPDAMHIVIGVLLLTALWSGIAGLIKLHRLSARSV